MLNFHLEQLKWIYSERNNNPLNLIIIILVL